MREIKFRAWKTKTGEMTYVSDFFWFEEKGVHDSSGVGHYAEYILMQYAGLKDKNGKEIYEGDIFPFEKCGDEGMHFTSVPGPARINLPVVFNDGAFIFNTPTKGGFLTPVRVTEDLVGSMSIIGNIYENPDLLEA